MPSWNDLLADILARGDDDAAGQRLNELKLGALQEIGKARGDRHVLFYASAFLQKPQAPAPMLQINSEDINGLMSVIYGMNWSKGLTLLLQCPFTGGPDLRRCGGIR